MYVWIAARDPVLVANRVEWGVGLNLVGKED